ncbi:MAG: hypothetical protein AAFN30_15655, partial [Actinomycetota bacterium]
MDWGRRQQFGGLKESPEVSSESCGGGAIDDPVIDGDREVHDLSDGDLVVDDPGLAGDASNQDPQSQ